MTHRSPARLLASRALMCAVAASLTGLPNPGPTTAQMLVPEASPSPAPAPTPSPSPAPAPSASGLVFSPLPPGALRPPEPNVIVTLDDSWSMWIETRFDATLDPTQSYPIPTGPDGSPLVSMPTGAGQTYGDGYAVNPAPMALPTSWYSDAPASTGFKRPTGVPLSYVDEYNALPVAQRPAYLRWFAFYRNRHMTMKASVLRAFNSTKLPDRAVRLAWQGMAGTCRWGFPSTPPAPSPPDCTANGVVLNNAMWPFDNATGSRNHRNNFFAWVRQQPLFESTPMRSAYVRAGEYLRTTGVNSPWSHLPGTQQTPERSCRRSYHLLFTDGEWTGSTAGNNVSDTCCENVPQSQFVVFDDNRWRDFPDGTVYYDPPNRESPNFRPYKGSLSAGGEGTLADLAFKYWITDLQTGAAFPNNVQPQMPVAGPQTYGQTSLPPYWNPANNPATWQHMVTYGIFMADSPTDTIPVPAWAGSTLGGTGFASIVDGTLNWPSVNLDSGQPSVFGRRADMWHAAINSRGQMFVSTNQAAVERAFSSILDQIMAQNVVSGRTAGSRVVLADGSRPMVRTGYATAPTMVGTLVAFDSLASSAPLWNGQDQLGAAAPCNRVVLTASAGDTGVGRAFRWSSLSTWQQQELSKLGSTVDSYGSFRTDYLRGDRRGEVGGNSASTVCSPSTAPQVFRARSGGLLGAIVNAPPEYVSAPRSGYLQLGYASFRATSRTPVVYVGANDGMLHGFNAQTGAPVLSYVPRGVFANLSAYTDPSYQHRWYVDGPLFSGDWHDGTRWRTLLVGGLGAGGRGLFGLDVTDPSAFSEASPASLVRFDFTAPPVAQTSASFTSEAGTPGPTPTLRTLATDLDMGHIFGDPARNTVLGRSLQIARVPNGKWALITGNGVNSSSRLAALYVIYLDGSGVIELKPESVLPTGFSATDSNGLSTPLPVDTNGDGMMDTVYAGDMLGRMWKFDLSSATDTNWKVVQVSGVNRPLIATGRPISSAPAVTPHPQGGMLVIFGTGRALTEADRNATTTEYLYGVWDKPDGPFEVTLSPTSMLDDRTLSGTPGAASGSNVLARVLASITSPVDYGTKRGWRVALGASSERVVLNPVADGRMVYFSTTLTLQQADPCVATPPGGSLLAFDALNGSEPSAPVLDLTGDGLITSADKISGKQVVGLNAGIGRLMGVVSPQAGRANAAPGCSGSLVVGATGDVCTRKASGGPGRRAWRTLTP